jgi:Ca-activated chloride channel family protein
MAVLLGAGTVEAATAAGMVRDGNRLFEAGDYDAAMQRYVEALVELPESAEIRFNLGNALYRLGRYPEAVEEYQKARSAADAGLSQAAQFNLGNTHFRMGRFEQAVVAFEQALRLDPGDLDAKRNLEIALARLEQQQERQRRPGQDPQQGPPPPASPKPPGPQEEPRQAPPTGSDRPEGEPPAPHDRMSRDEAIRLLEALQEDEKQSLRRGLQLPPRRPARGEDW